MTARCSKSARSAKYDTPSSSSLLALLGLAVFSTAFAFVIYFRLIQTLGSVGTTAQPYLRVPALRSANCFLGERLTAAAWLGLACVVIVIGVAAMAMPARKVAVAGASS
jgi:drug/metabolite transporter (DMT)-like permease